VAQAAAGKVERAEVAGFLKTLRDHDPCREDAYTKPAPVEEATAFILRGADHEARTERLQERNGQQTSGVQVGDEDVIVGDIRLGKRKKGAV
jgi:hypothetical protein